MADQVKWRTVFIALGATGLLAGGGLFAANAAGILERPAPEPTSVVQEEATTPSATPTPTPTTEPVGDAPPVVEPAPVAEVPAVDEPAPDYGQPIPWIADPNNAEGGYWDTTQCPSSAGYQAPDGNQYCAP